MSAPSSVIDSLEGIKQVLEASGPKRCAAQCFVAGVEEKGSKIMQHYRDEEMYQSDHAAATTHNELYGGNSGGTNTTIRLRGSRRMLRTSLMNCARSRVKAK